MSLPGLEQEGALRKGWLGRGHFLTLQKGLCFASVPVTPVLSIKAAPSSWGTPAPDPAPGDLALS